MSKRDRKVLTRVLLPELQDAKDQFDQWMKMNEIESAAKYHARLETLVEVMEVANCGSVGGFDTAQDTSGLTQCVVDRFQWLKLRAQKEFGFTVKVDED